MTEPKPFASLSPSLLARKGGARPAMRPQLHPVHHFHEMTTHQLEEDLGWNDMGHDEDVADWEPVPLPSAPLPEMPEAKRARRGSFARLEAKAGPEADIVSLDGSLPVTAEVPEIVRQQAEVAKIVAKGGATRPTRARKSALAGGRRAAFTLRLDAERHLKLRLACTIDNRSAQQIVTDALDRLIADMPELEALASQVKKRN